jgi:mRNA interferase MazF
MFSQGDVVTVPFPFTNLNERKLRPALVISNGKLNDSGDLILVMITSKEKHDGFGLEIQDEQLTVALPKKSFVRFNRVVTIDESLVIKKLCEADHQLVAEVILRLNTLLEKDMSLEDVDFDNS